MKIIVVEDSVLLRAGLVRLLAEAGHDVVADVDRADDLVDLVTERDADLVILDVRLPPDFTDEGVRAAGHLLDHSPQVAILLLSQYVERRHAVDLLGRSTTGLGYLLKDRVIDVGEFLDEVDRVGSGESVIDPVVVRQLFSRVRSPLSRLTPREREVLGLMAEGRSNRWIADDLVVSDGAVEKHITNILMKLDLSPDDDTEHRRVKAVLMWLDHEAAAPTG
jgi:DNA-binding NarL/FixJ family response regulator